LIVVCGLASVALGLPMGPGGTLYFSTGGQGGVGSQVYYVDVDQNFNAIEVAPGQSCVSVGTVTANKDERVYGNYPADFGRLDVWYNSDGNLDMGGEYHNATLLTAAYYNTTPAGGTSSTQGADIVVLSPAYTVGGPLNISVINDGWNSTTTGTASTVSMNGVVRVDSAFTPNGEAVGIVDGAFQGNGSNSGVWVDSDGDGQYGGVAGEYTNLTGTEQMRLAYGAGTLAAGVGSTSIRVTTRTGVGTYSSFVATAANAGQLAVDDVDGDGIADIYAASGNKLYRYTDLNGNGNFNDAGESLDIGFAAGNNGVTPYGTELIQYVDPNTEAVFWTALWYGFENSYGAYSHSDHKVVYAIGLGADGLWDGEAWSEVIYYCPSNATGDASFADASVLRGNLMAFAPLGEESSGEVPEPGTMLLVGTGILSLAGVVRRRLIG